MLALLLTGEEAAAADMEEAAMTGEAVVAAGMTVARAVTAVVAVEVGRRDGDTVAEDEAVSDDVACLHHAGLHAAVCSRCSESVHGACAPALLYWGFCASRVSCAPLCIGM